MRTIKHASFAVAGLGDDAQGVVTIPAVPNHVPATVRVLAHTVDDPATNVSAPDHSIAWAVQRAIAPLVDATDLGGTELTGMSDGLPERVAMPNIEAGKDFYVHCTRKSEGGTEAARTVRVFVQTTWVRER